ncbi:DNA ligase [Shewanella glacialimarina]|uniref:DNA ligase n=1 Tax=Shewanella glacialimarina TaxID=2590884 RepID=UPI001CF8D741|nr:DNA ligase [Shewanella glacialimarina]UCX05057.1 DNA ligase [Shewanella glacialimarina]
MNKFLICITAINNQQVNLKHTSTNYNLLGYYLVMIGVLIMHFLSSYAQAEEVIPKPKIQLAKSLTGAIHIEDYLVSEKLDGVRGYWDGKQLLTKSGRLINPPAWFIKDFPNTVLEGELWIGRGQFEAISGLVRQAEADDAAWHKVKLMLFDLPLSELTFEHRYQQLQVIAAKSEYLQAIEQVTISSELELYQRLKHVVAQGAEGLMLHRKQATYATGRTDNILKLKLKSDADAMVIGHTEGKGKYTGVMGALTVKMPNGIVFDIGTGFSDLQRQTPPSIGTLISYHHIGFTKNGVPRFASFWRVRDDEPKEP